MVIVQLPLTFNKSEQIRERIFALGQGFGGRVQLRPQRLSNREAQGTGLCLTLQ